MKNFLLRLTVAVMAFTMVFSMFTVSAASEAIPKGTPKLDGVEEKMWESASAKIPINMSRTGDEATNATGYARVMWDDKFLYCIGVVKDSTPSSGTGTPEKAWYTDSFEIFLDEENKGTGELPIAQFRVDTKSRLSGMLQHTVKDEAGMKKEYKNTKWAVKTNKSGYVVEIAIPWTRISPKADKTEIGLEFQINDEKDNSGYQDGSITSPCTNMWKCEYFRNLVLSSKAVSSGETSSNTSSKSDGKQNTTSKNESSAQGGTTSKQESNSSVKAENNDVDEERNNEKTEDNKNNTASNTDTENNAVDVENNDVDTENNELSVENDRQSETDTSILGGNNGKLSPLLIALGVVIVVCTLAILAVLIYVMVSNSKNKKLAKPQKEENND